MGTRLYEAISFLPAQPLQLFRCAGASNRSRRVGGKGGNSYPENLRRLRMGERESFVSCDSSLPGGWAHAGT